MKYEDICHQSFIGIYEIDHDICDDLVAVYEENEHHISDGVQASVDGLPFVDKNVKDSRDLTFEPDGRLSVTDAIASKSPPDPRVHRFMESLVECLRKYHASYHLVPPQLVISEGWNVQRYPPGGGFTRTHCERHNRNHPSVYRSLVWMTYLNDVPDGGTSFPNQGITTKAVKGNTLIWPADWTHAHAGVPSPNTVKTIATGWFSL